MSRRQMIIVIAIVWLIIQFVAMAVFREFYLYVRVVLAVPLAGCMLGWGGPRSPLKFEEDFDVVVRAYVYPLILDGALYAVVLFAIINRNPDGGGMGLALVLGMLYLSYAAVGAVIRLARFGFWSAKKSAGSIRAASLHPHLHEHGYHWMSVADCANLWGLCGEDAFLLPPWEHCGVLPEVNEGDLESLARVAKLRQETRSGPTAFS